MFTHLFSSVMAGVAETAAGSDTSTDGVTVAATIGIAVILIVNLIKESLPPA